MLKSRLLAILGVAVTGLLTYPAHALTIAEIGAGYDTSCNLDPTCAAAVAGGASFSGNLTSDPANAVYDDPSLFIYNATPYDFTLATLTGHGYQGANSGLTQSPGAFPVGPASFFPTTIAANSVYQFSWDDVPGSATCGPFPGILFSYDYDDEIGCSSAAQPGNVELIFAAHWNNPAYNSGAGVDVHTVAFSPNSNLTGSFFGFEGLDETGNAESVWDSHSPAPGAYVANIEIGPAGGFGAPEPSSMLLLGAGLAGFAAMRRARKDR